MLAQLMLAQLMLAQLMLAQLMLAQLMLAQLMLAQLMLTQPRAAHEAYQASSRALPEPISRGIAYSYDYIYMLSFTFCRLHAV